MNAEYNALKALLESVPLLAGNVHGPDEEEPKRGTYLLTFPAGPEGLDDARWATIPRPDSDAEYSFPLRAVSTDLTGVMLIADAVRGLVGRKLTVAGRRCDPITVEFDPVKKDNAVSPALFFMNMWVEFWSRRG